MKVLVIGKGLAAFGLIWEICRSEHLKTAIELQWVAPPISLKDAGHCSLHSTALVARQGIERGISPLGDLLYESYFLACEFFDLFAPRGVSKVIREHFASDDHHRKENARRFGSDKYPLTEEAYIIRPLEFLQSWEELIFKEWPRKWPRPTSIDDFIIDIKYPRAQGIKESYSFDLVFDCRGSGLKDYYDLQEDFKKSPGHFLRWTNPLLGPQLRDCSWVKTVDGHNLIYHYNTDNTDNADADADKDKDKDKVGELILGGSTEKDEYSAPSFGQLSNQLSSFKKVFSELEGLEISDAEVATGIRSKGRKRMPFFKERSPHHFLVGGFYKNGYTLCFGANTINIQRVFKC